MRRTLEFQSCDYYKSKYFVEKYLYFSILGGFNVAVAFIAFIIIFDLIIGAFLLRSTKDIVSHSRIIAMLND